MGSQAGYPLEGFPVGHLTVVQAARHIDGGIRGLVQVVVGAQAAHRGIVTRDGPIAPLGVLLPGEGQLGILHGAQQVDEGNLQHGPGETGWAPG